MLWNLKDALSDALVRAVRAPGSAHRVEIPNARQGRVGRVGCLDGRPALLAPLAHGSDSGFLMAPGTGMNSPVSVSTQAVNPRLLSRLISRSAASNWTVAVAAARRPAMR